MVAKRVLCAPKTVNVSFVVVFFFSSLQSYRDLKEVTPEALQMVKRNFEWVAERVEVSVFINDISRL